ncbi:hypothetical protein ACHRV1_05165 [Flavobacterium aquidurense]|uniref:hypothetical protein n=1 Tax=Flavobacterium aquidurense TaxID=362413 RepID=UPI003758012C
MSKNAIHNFNLSIQNSADIKSSEDLTKTIIKELAKVSKEMSQQKDIVQEWQEQKKQNAAAFANNSIASTEGGAIDTKAEIKETALSIGNTPLENEGMSNLDVSSAAISLSTTSTSSALIGGGVVDTTGRTTIISVVSDNTTPPASGAESNTLNFSSGITTQTYASVAAQEMLTVPQEFQTNNNEPKTEVVKAEIEKRLEAAMAANNTVEIVYWRNISKAFDEGGTAEDFDGKKDEEYFKQIEKKQLDKIHQITINNVNWEEVSGLMILKLSELSKERKDVYLKEYYDKLIKKIKNPEINIQQLFLEHDELFLLLKSIFPNLPDKIIINTQKKVYPDLSPQRIYPDIGVEKMYFIWSGTLFDDIKYRYNEREFQDKSSNLLGYNTFNYEHELYEKKNSVNFDKEFASYDSNVSKSSIDVKGESDIVPPVTKISSTTIQIGNKKWIDRFKFDYVLDNNEGGGEWMYNKAKKEMNASSFGAALIMAFAIEEGGWGKGNDQSNTHNAFSLLSKKAKSKAGTAHGNVITYANWDEGFKAFKDLINKKYASFNDLLIKDNVSADDINKALFSGTFHKLGGYTDSDKGKAILGVMKYGIIFRVHDIKEQIKTLSKKNELLKANEVFKPVEENLFNPKSNNKTPKDLEIEFYNNAIKELETEKKELETSYDKL